MVGSVPVSLSFYGRVSLDRANNLEVDITFSGGSLPPDMGELTARVESSGLSRRQQRPLLATLEAAQRSLAAGDCETAIRVLQVFQHKVSAQLGRTEEALANALIAAARSIIDSACDN
jgi:DNA-binding response OmpR family regulator